MLLLSYYDKIYIIRLYMIIHEKALNERDNRETHYVIGENI